MVHDRLLLINLVERHDLHNSTVFGEGYWAHNQDEQKAAEVFDLHPSKYHVAEKRA